MKLELEDKLRDKLVLDHIISVIASDSDLKRNLSQSMMTEFGVTYDEFDDWLSEIDVMRL